MNKAVQDAGGGEADKRDRKVKREAFGASMVATQIVDILQENQMTRDYNSALADPIPPENAEQALKLLNDVFNNYMIFFGSDRSEQQAERAASELSNHYQELADLLREMQKSEYQ